MTHRGLAALEKDCGLFVSFWGSPGDGDVLCVFTRGCRAVDGVGDGRQECGHNEILEGV